MKADENIWTVADQILELEPTSLESNIGFVRVKVHELMYLISNRLQSTQFEHFLVGLPAPRERGIKPFMESNFSKPLKVADFAYLTGRSVTAFRSDFKAVYGETPHKWLKRRRIQKAMDLANRTQLTVGQMALEAGYLSTSYFIREFRQTVGKSPGEYIETLRAPA